MEKQYLELLNTVLETGIFTEDRTGTGTYSIPHAMISHDMSKGFPLLTTKRIAWKSSKVELEGFIKGITDKQWYRDRECRIWDQWSSNIHLCSSLSKEEKNKYMFDDRDLGPIYGFNWSNFNGDYKPIPTIHTCFDKQIIIEKSEDPLVGTKHDSKYGKFTVISLQDKGKKGVSAKYNIQFNVSGYKSIVRKDCIKKLKVRDPYFPIIAGVGALGEEDSNIDSSLYKILYNTWSGMIHRCYDASNRNYPYYGALNCFVSNEWLVFSKFVKDVINFEGFENKVNYPKFYQIDKDKSGNNFYSKQTCCWVTVEEQMGMRSYNSFIYEAEYKDGKKIQFTNLSKFSRDHGILPHIAYRNLLNSTECEGIYLKKISKFKDKKDTTIGTNQLIKILNTLKTNPSDRRMLVLAWNPNQLNDMALPPCHYAWQVSVIGNKLHLNWVQRSCDLFLGIPWNITFYALLLELLAKHAGLRPGTLTGFLTNVHIYSNHIDQVKEQLSRIPFELPALALTNDEFYDWDHTKANIINYQHHPSIKAPVAV